MITTLTDVLYERFLWKRCSTPWLQKKVLQTLKIMTLTYGITSGIYSFILVLTVIFLMENKNWSNNKIEPQHTIIMLWFNFILGSVFISLCVVLIIRHYNTQKQREIKTEPSIKLNHNICIQDTFKKN